MARTQRINASGFGSGVLGSGFGEECCTAASGSGAEEPAEEAPYK